MSDPLRTDAGRAADALSGLERDARIEQLLLQGLDAYFAGAYESAIHVWTRVLFLDRGHDRARAYIERARSAQAERQRESEELLHRGVAAFDRGETTSARSLLSAAASQGASPEVALSYLERLERLDAPARPPAAFEELGDPHPTPGPPVPSRNGAARPWRLYLLGIVSIVAVSVAGWAGLVLFELADIRAALQRAPAAAPAPAAVEEAVPVPRQAEIVLAQARAQYRAGHVIDALRLLDTIGPFDPAEGEADQLRAEIQQALGIVPASTSPGPAPREAPARPQP